MPAAESPKIIYEWAFADIEQAIARYFATEVTARDKAALLLHSSSLIAQEEFISTSTVTAEEHIRLCLSVGPINYHQVTTTSDSGRPSPSDVHANISVWDAQEVGILTTYLGWILFRREDGGILHLSRLIAFDQSLASDGYITPATVTIHHFHYWFSRVAQRTELMRETRLVVEAVELTQTELAVPRVDDVRTSLSMAMNVTPGTNIQTPERRPRPPDLQII